MASLYNTHFIMTQLTTSVQVERAIEIALANPVDFEYAIDKEVSFISVF